MLSSPQDVVRCLITYSDWWQPATSSILQVGAARRGDRNDGMRAGVVETLDERTELRRRIDGLEEREGKLLFLWYVTELPVGEIARAVGISRRHCFRVRSRAIHKIVEMAERDAA